MMTQTQIALIAEQVTTRRGESALPFAMQQAEMAVRCGDKGAELIWREIAAALSPGAALSAPPSA